MSARGEPGVHGPKARGPKDKRQADRSDVRQEFVPKRARTGFEPWQADGRQRFMPRVSLEPLPFDASLGLAHAMRMRPLFVGRFVSAFRSATDYDDAIPIPCKQIAAMAAMMVNRKDTAGAYRAGGPGLPRLAPSPIGRSDSRNRP